MYGTVFEMNKYQKSTTKEMLQFFVLMFGRYLT